MSGFGYNVNGFGSFPSRGPAPVAVQYVVIAGGGGGGYYMAGAGGGGGILTGTANIEIAVAQQITVGGGASSTWSTDNHGYNGGNSVFTPIGTVTGGGGGGRGGNTDKDDGRDGGSGGGGGYGGAAGTGVAGPPRQGYNGGVGVSGYAYGAGGGGAGGTGEGSNSTRPGNGGTGVDINSIIASTANNYNLVCGGGGGGSTQGNQRSNATYGGGRGAATSYNANHDTDEEAGAAGVALGRVAALTAVASIILVGHKAAVGLFGCAIQTRTQQLSLLEFLLIQRTPVAAI